jgi:hypothetical protein
LYILYTAYAGSLAVAADESAAAAGAVTDNDSPKTAATHKQAVKEAFHFRLDIFINLIISSMTLFNF